MACPLAAGAAATLDVRHRPASRRIGRLERWVELLDSSDHVLVRALAPFVLLARTGPQWPLLKTSAV